VGEAPELEVAAVHLQQRPRLGAHSGLVVAQVRAIRGADLAEPRAALRHHVGHAKRAADLDQLAPRQDHLAVRGQRVEREQHRGRVVVDDERVLGAGRLAQQLAHHLHPRATPAARHVELEVGVPGRRHGHRRGGLCGEGSAPQVRVEHHARRIEHGPGPGPNEAVCLDAHGPDQLVLGGHRRRVRHHRRPGPLEDGARRLQERPARKPGSGPRPFDQRIDRWKLAKPCIDRLWSVH
jgi:hypothetical protein